VVEKLLVDRERRDDNEVDDLRGGMGAQEVWRRGEGGRGEEGLPPSHTRLTSASFRSIASRSMKRAFTAAPASFHT